MSKLNWHLQNIPGWAQSVINSEYVKLIDPPNDNPFPGRKVIGRVYIPDEESNAMVSHGVAGVAAWWNRVAPIMTTRKYVWAWCLPNEPQPVANWDFCNQLADFTIEASYVMHSYGLRVIGGELAEGNPGGATDLERANLFCAIARSLAGCDYWSQHAYWVPDGYSHPEAGYNKWHALRYQMNRGYAQARGIKLPPVLLTEAGWDFGIVGRPREGWHGHASWAAYFDDLKMFDKDIMADPDCLGATLFVSGANQDWLSFEIGEQESKSMASYIQLPLEFPITPPVVEPCPKLLTIGRPLVSNVGSVSQVFGANVAKYLPLGFAGHEGLDYTCPVGSKVLATAPGTVSFVGTSTGANAAYGRYVVINHGKFESWYCHLLATMIIKGQPVVQGQQIGLSGNTGSSTGPHLHFGIRVPTAKNGSKGFIDPWGLRVILGGA